VQIGCVSVSCSLAIVYRQQLSRQRLTAYMCCCYVLMYSHRESITCIDATYTSEASSLPTTMTSSQAPQQTLLVCTSSKDCTLKLTALLPTVSNSTTATSNSGSTASPVSVRSLYKIRASSLNTSSDSSSTTETTSADGSTNSTTNSSIMGLKAVLKRQFAHTDYLALGCCALSNNADFALAGCW
jgi:hypothetical protein